MLQNSASIYEALLPPRRLSYGGVLNKLDWLETAKLIILYTIKPCQTSVHQDLLQHLSVHHSNSEWERQPVGGQ